MAPEKKTRLLKISGAMAGTYLLWLTLTVMQVIPDGWWGSWPVGLTLLTATTLPLVKALGRKPRLEDKPAHKQFDPSRRRQRNTQMIFEPEAPAQEPLPPKAPEQPLQQPALPSLPSLEEAAPSMARAALEDPFNPWGSDTPTPEQLNTEDVPQLTQAVLARVQLQQRELVTAYARSLEEPAAAPAMAQPQMFTAPPEQDHYPQARPQDAPELDLLPFADDPVAFQSTPGLDQLRQQEQLAQTQPPNIDDLLALIPDAPGAPLHEANDQSIDLGHFPLSWDEAGQVAPSMVGFYEHEEDASMDIWKCTGMASIAHEPVSPSVLQSHLADYSIAVLRSQEGDFPDDDDDIPEDSAPLSRVLGDLALSSNTLYQARELSTDAHDRDYKEEVDQVISYYQNQQGSPQHEEGRQPDNLKARLKKLRNLTHELRRSSDDEPAPRSPLASYTQKAAHGAQAAPKAGPPWQGPPLGGPKPNFNAFDVPTRRADQFYQDAIRQNSDVPEEAAPAPRPHQASYNRAPFASGIGTITTEDLNTLWCDFVEANQECGRNTGGLRPDVFLQHIKKNYRVICQKYRCQHVQFTVKIKKGRPTLSARPGKASA